jgi:hypothetical protein
MSSLQSGTKEATIRKVRKGLYRSFKFHLDDWGLPHTSAIKVAQSSSMNELRRNLRVQSCREEASAIARQLSRFDRAEDEDGLAELAGNRTGPLMP